MGFFRKVWPKHTIADKVAFSFTHFGLTFIVIFQWFTVLPLYHEPFTKMYNLHVISGLFILFQVFSNLYKMLLIDATIKSPNLNLPSVLQEGWYYCSFCQMNAPPRAHHCPVCDVCVIKRDHHCIFTGNCVGHLNHRNFIIMVFYLWLGCFYTTLFNLEFYTNIIGSLNFYYFLKIVFPMVAFLGGYVTSYQLYILIVSGVNFMAMLLFSFLNGFQIYFISRGETQFECKKKIREYSGTFHENWKVVLGKRWYLTPFSAYVRSPLPYDGTDYKKTAHVLMDVIHENAKTI